MVGRKLLNSNSKAHFVLQPGSQWLHRLAGPGSSWHGSAGAWAGEEGWWLLTRRRKGVGSTTSCEVWLPGWRRCFCTFRCGVHAWSLDDLLRDAFPEYLRHGFLSS
jgi:hypothetical protein